MRQDNGKRAGTTVGAGVVAGVGSGFRAKVDVGRGKGYTGSFRKLESVMGKEIVFASVNMNAAVVLVMCAEEIAVEAKFACMGAVCGCLSVYVMHEKPSALPGAMKCIQRQAEDIALLGYNLSGDARQWVT